MMAIEKVVFETEDGKQFQTLEAACEHELRVDILDSIREGCYGNDFEEIEALNALLRDFNITRKEKESD